MAETQSYTFFLIFACHIKQIKLWLKNWIIRMFRMDLRIV